MKVLKQGVARKLLDDGSHHLWQKRSYDFNVYFGGEVHGKAPLDASESGEARIGARA
jgi:hypothetical protein